MRKSIVIGAVLLPAAALAQSGATHLMVDEPANVNGIESVCAGVGEESMSDPRWPSYPIKLEFASGTGHYVAGEVVTLSGATGGAAGGAAILSVSCNGPWLLFRLPAGKYHVRADLVGAERQEVVITVPETGQARVVIRFPEIIVPGPPGGQVPHTN